MKKLLLPLTLLICLLAANCGPPPESYNSLRVYERVRPPTPRPPNIAKPGC
jgi:hypothetical protein